MSKEIYQEKENAKHYHFCKLPHMSEIYLFIRKSIQTANICQVDNLDTKLHPFLTRKIISIFNSRRGNPNNAQLIFAPHDTNLLNNEILRRDQIWFAEKGKPHEATELKRLSGIEMSDEGEFRKVRRDRIIEKELLRQEIRSPARGQRRFQFNRGYGGVREQ